jgi:hypothetical protein
MKIDAIHEAIWDSVTFVGLDGPFRTRTMIEELAAACKWSRKTASCYWSDWTRWALAHPEEFHGPVSRLVRIRHGLYQLVDGVPHPENETEAAIP